MSEILDTIDLLKLNTDNYIDLINMPTMLYFYANKKKLWNDINVYE